MAPCSSNKCKIVRSKAKAGAKKASIARKHNISRKTVRNIIKKKPTRAEKTQLYKRAVNQACRKLVVKPIQRPARRGGAGRQSCRRGKTVSAVEVEAYMKECFKSCGLKEAPTISPATVRNYLKLVPEKFKVRTERDALHPNEANTKNPTPRQGWNIGR
jgi:DNA-binding CsgD family transcriptional regulator